MTICEQRLANNHGPDVACPKKMQLPLDYNSSMAVQKIDALKWLSKK
jgi:hypothetical protein